MVRICSVLAGVLVATAVTTISSPARAAGATDRVPQVTPQVAPGTGQAGLADEITRRLRRMGFEYIEVRNKRPREMRGELC